MTQTTNEKTAAFDFDIFVIGGGSGGVRAARMAAARGAKVAIAEGAKMGGTCVNVGCIPKKLYSFAAHYGDGFIQAAGYGWEMKDNPRLNWETLKANRAKEINRLNGIYEGLMKNAQVTHFQGWASFADQHTIKITKENGEVHTVCAEKIIIATGGKPVLPDFEGREFLISSDDIFDLPDFPKNLVIIGGGYIGCEMASIFHGLGAHVDLILRDCEVLRGFDEEVRQFTGEQMRQLGVKMHVKNGIERIQKNADGRLSVVLKDGQTLVADHVLAATGRRPLVDGLGLERIGVAQKENGAIVVNDDFQTNIAHIYAVGDVIDRKALTPVALGEAMALVDILLGAAPGKSARKISYKNIPTAVFTHPNIGTVGLTEEQAREMASQNGGGIRVYRSDFRALKHTLTSSSERTLVKMIVDDASDRVLGLHMVGENAGEIIQGFAVALQCGATKSHFDATIGIHPTTAEEFVTLREISRR